MGWDIFDVHFFFFFSVQGFVSEACYFVKTLELFDEKHTSFCVFRHKGDKELNLDASTRGVWHSVTHQPKQKLAQCWPGITGELMAVIWGPFY